MCRVVQLAGGELTWSVGEVVYVKVAHSPLFSVRWCFLLQVAASATFAAQANFAIRLMFVAVQAINSCISTFSVPR